jgi:hypothetical protein
MRLREIPPRAEESRAILDDPEAHGLIEAFRGMAISRPPPFRPRPPSVANCRIRGPPLNAARVLGAAPWLTDAVLCPPRRAAAPVAAVIDAYADRPIRPQKVGDREDANVDVDDQANEYGEFHPDNDYPEETGECVFYPEGSEEGFADGPSVCEFPTGLCYDAFEYGVEVGGEEEG